MKLMPSNICRMALFLLLLAGGLLQLKIALFEQTKFSRPRPHSTLWRQQISSAYLNAAADDAYLLRGRSDKARRLLQRALTLNPLYIPAWITLSELDMYQGHFEPARKILAYIDGRMVGVALWRWQKTMLAYQLGDRTILARDLDYVVAELPEHRQSALALAASLWPRAASRLEKLGFHNLVYLFRYSLQPARLEQALAYWPQVRGCEELKLRDKLRFIELLRRHKKIGVALRIWREEFKTAAILYNGDFATPPLQTAFGWRISTPAGTSWELIPQTDHKNSAFHLWFAGSENINYHHLLQYFIPVAAVNSGSDQTKTAAGVECSLSGEVRCNGLTTDQRPYFEVAGVDAKSLRTRTPMFAATQDFTRFSLNFTVAPDCRQVYVQLRRNPSRDINCRIAGEIWINNLRITTNELNHD